MSESKLQKCHAGGMCKHLADRIVGSLLTGGVGFHEVNTIDIESKATTFQGVCYKKNKKDRGLMLNLCPFCGGRPGVSAQSKDEKRQPTGETIELLEFSDFLKLPKDQIRPALRSFEKAIMAIRVTASLIGDADLAHAFGFRIRKIIHTDDGLDGNTDIVFREEKRGESADV